MEKISSSEEKVIKNKTMEKLSTLKDISAEDFEVITENNDIKVPTKTTVKYKTMEELSTLKDISAEVFEVTTENNDIKVPTKTTVKNNISTFHPSAETFHENFNQELKNKTFDTDKDFEAEQESVSDETIEVSDNLEPMLKNITYEISTKEPESVSDDLEFQKATKNENSTIDLELLSNDDTDLDTKSTNFSEHIKVDPIDRFESTEIVPRIIRYGELNLESAGSIKNISNETKVDPTNKVDNESSYYVTIYIIAAIATVFLILIGTLFCTFLSLAKKYEKRKCY